MMEGIKNMATREELREALDDYVANAGNNERVQRSLKSWNCVIYIEASDVDASFTMTIASVVTRPWSLLGMASSRMRLTSNGGTIPTRASSTIVMRKPTSIRR